MGIFRKATRLGGRVAKNAARQIVMPEDEKSKKGKDDKAAEPAAPQHSDAEYDELQEKYNALMTEKWKEYYKTSCDGECETCEYYDWCPDDFDGVFEDEAPAEDAKAAPAEAAEKAAEGAEADEAAETEEADRAAEVKAEEENDVELTDEERAAKARASMVKNSSASTLEELYSKLEQGEVKDLNIIVKADVQGSVEAVKQSLEKLSNAEVRVRTIHSGVGAITENDVMLAGIDGAIIIGFNVRPDAKARDAANRDGIDIRYYRVIYQAIEDIEKAMKGMLTPEFRENVIGHAEVRNVFKITGVGIVAGSYVTDGKLQRNAQVRLLRDNVVVYEGKLSSLQRFKDAVKEVADGYECGVCLENYTDIKEGDVIECFVMEEIPR